MTMFILGVVLVFIVLGLYSCCVVAGRSDRNSSYDYYREEDTYFSEQEQLKEVR